MQPAAFDPSRFGIAASAPDALRGGDRVHNAQVARDLLAGAAAPAVRDAVVLNAAAAVAAYDGLDGRNFDDAIAYGIDEARAAIDSGAAADKLERWIEASQRARPQLNPRRRNRGTRSAH